MSAALLQLAATLMRERALSAEPGRWKAWGMDVMADPMGTSNVDDAILVARPVTPSTSERRLHTGNTDHIASWHPAVALAVADWLDATAEAHTHGAGDVVIDMWSLPGMDKHPALAVARTYLGAEVKA